MNTIELNKVMRKRTGEEWLMYINCIENEDERIQVGCFIWWDYSEQSRGNKHVKVFTDLDHFPKMWTPMIHVPPSRLVRHFLNMGFPLDYAQERVRPRHIKYLCTTEGDA